MGKPGGGKSMLGTRFIVDELLSSDRYICTNSALLLDRLAEYVQNEVKLDEGERDEERSRRLDIAQRVRILSDEEAAQFWLHEGPNRSALERRKIKQGDLVLDVPDFRERQKTTPGVLYVIDECHVYFDARRWQTVSTDARFFLSQHRKLFCDVILITQHPDQVDKGFRLLAQDYTTVRNFGNETIMGFTWKGMFRWATYQSIPRPGGNVPTSATGTFKLDVKGLASLYDTTAGAGVLGRQAIKEKRSGGRHPLWLVPICLAALAVIWWGPKLGNQLLGKALTKTFEASEATTAKALGLTNTTFQSAITPPTVQPQFPQAGAIVPKGKPTTVIRVMIMPNRSEWELSDGRIVSNITPGFMAGDEYGLIYRGEYFPKSPSKPSFGWIERKPDDNNANRQTTNAAPGPAVSPTVDRTGIELTPVNH